MKIEIKTKDLKNAVNFLAQIAPRRTYKPILRCVKIETVESAVRISATDLKFTGRVLLAADTKETGAVVLSVETLVNAAKAKSETLVIENNKISSDKITWTAETYPVDNFPTAVISEAYCKNSQTHDAQSFIDNAKIATLASAKENSRYDLTSICYTGDKFMGTNGRSLVYVPTGLPAQEQKILIPAKIIGCLDKIKTANTLMLCYNTKKTEYGDTANIYIGVDNYEIWTATEGRFPDTSTIWLNVPVFAVNIKVKELQAALENFQNLEDCPTKWTFNGRLTISNNACSVDVAIDNPLPAEFVIGFNPDILLPILKKAKGDTITMEGQNIERPLQITAANLKYIQMPARKERNY